MKIEILGTGCPKCKQTGYVGRIGIFELLMVDGNIRQMIAERVSVQNIKCYAVEKGMKTLFMDGLNKVMQGSTTLQ